ncbi:MAG: 7-carboxy-7-deazaguanine synthase QueE [Rickettsiales bacterium]|nr:7-carboxy-7-deazaguanine synthase QueE [Rickettsiales bacterium]
MFGKNKILKPEIHDGSHLDVVEIFPTFQGEGPYVGHPSVFVRLGGCNLACDFCDTEFDSYQNLSLEKILTEVTTCAKNEAGEVVRKLVVITGGEPLRQPIERFCQELLSLNFLVQIETNGTLFRELPQEVKIICSPKISNGKYHQIRPDLLARIDAFKFIISRGKKEYSQVDEFGLNVPIYLQPMDEYDEAKNKENLALVLELAQKFGHRVSLQMHKILKIR